MFLGDLLALHDEHLVRVEEAAIAAKDAKGRLVARVGTDLVAQGVLSGSIWGALTGALFLEPFFGLLVGGLFGWLTGGALKEAHTGISRRVVTRTAKRVLEPESSALYLLVSKMTPDKVAARLYEHDATIVSTSLSVDREKELRQAWIDVRRQGPLAIQSRDRSRTRLLPSGT